MNFFLDTEFAETGGEKRPTIDLISIGIVAEDGREFYAESEEFDLANCDDWVKKHVVAKLGPANERMSRVELRNRLLSFLGKEPVIWAYYPSYDWVAFCWLFGKMIDLPKGYPMFPMDLQQWWVQLGRPPGVKPPDPTDAHNALADARWTRDLHANLVAFNEAIDEVKKWDNKQLHKILDEISPRENEIDSVMSLLNWARTNHDPDSAARVWLERVVAQATRL